MLDIKYIRENKEKIKKALAKRPGTYDIDELLELDNQRKKILEKIEDLRSERNRLSVGRDIVSQKQVRDIKFKLRELEPELTKIEADFFKVSSRMPNIPDKDVPPYKDGNKVVKSWGLKPKFDFQPLDHLELGESLDIIDTQKAAEISGSRFGFLKNEAALLEFALIQYLINKLKDKGFTFMIPPVLVQEKAMFGTGFFPTEKNESYKIENEDLYLVGTAEVPLASYHAGEIIKPPKKYVGFSSCFRKEAGSYGKDVKGILRVHQFDKMEMFVFSEPGESWKIFDELSKINEEIFKDLKLPYQIIVCSGADTGIPNARRYDTEVWIPSQEKYRELASCSNDTDFQSRRLNIKYRKKDGNTDYVHTINDTALAIGRTIAAILENYQQKDGSVKIPEVLQKYTQFKEIRR